MVAKRRSTKLNRGAKSGKLRRLMSTTLIVMVFILSATLACFVSVPTAEARRPCDPCLINPPFPSGSNWNKAPQYTTTGNGQIQEALYTASASAGTVSIAAKGVAGLAAGSNAGGSVTEELRAGFEFPYSGSLGTGTYNQEFIWTITANGQGGSLGTSSASCTSGQNVAANGWIEVKANMWDSTTSSWVYSSDQSYTVYTFSGDSQENIATNTQIVQSINPSLTSSNTYSFYFYLDVYIYAYTGNPGCSATAWLDVATSGNGASVYLDSAF